MVSEIRIYVEGGGDSRNTRSSFREGMSKFLADIKRKANNRRVKFRIIVCGGRASTFNDFRKALKTHKTSLNILLVDSESPVNLPSFITPNAETERPMDQPTEAELEAKAKANRKEMGQFAKQHLMKRVGDEWSMAGMEDEHIHLMVQVMESWVIADLEALKKFYGSDFNSNAIPKNSNVEQISKQTIEKGLKQATRHCQKGEYHKINHGPQILGTVDTQLVRSKSKFCDRLFLTLSDLIQGRVA